MEKKYYKFSKKNEYRFDLPKHRVSSGKNKKGAVASLIINITIRMVALAVFVVSAYMLVDRFMDYSKDIKYNESISSDFDVNSTVSQTSKTEREVPDYPEYEGSTKVITEYPIACSQESITQLTLAYPDFKFWFYIDGTTVSYPVVQSNDNDYYLRRNLDGDENVSGTLFLDYRNDASTMGGHTIIYGHNMQNGTMFGALRKLENRSYWQEHNMIYTYTDTTVTAWKIFSAYETTTEDNYIETNFATEEEYKAFIDKIKGDSLYSTDVQVTAQDDIMTLSTCHNYTYSNGRFVVHAVKLTTEPLV